MKLAARPARFGLHPAGGAFPGLGLAGDTALCGALGFTLGGGGKAGFQGGACISQCRVYARPCVLSHLPKYR